MLTTVEQLHAVELLKASFVAYPLLNALHILSIGVLVGSILLMDLRIIGVARYVDAATHFRFMRRAIAIALSFAVTSGLALFSIRASEYAVNPAFQVKLLLLALAGLNFVIFHMFARTPEPTGAAKLVAALSMCLWVSILVAGRFIGFV
ncbi:DUF6644 family protein [Mesorhizobium sp. CAU 1741]|uniref:DUF6644 family protein n=1 Tax=Mesorhizobium sp. CAU 1741 TaxID=3140366 RepID=UPI00325C0438